MFSQFLSIKPNPDYVPGGVENFWLTASSTPGKKEGKSGEGMRPATGSVSSSSEAEEAGRKAGGKNAFVRPEGECMGVGGPRRLLFA